MQLDARGLGLVLGTIAGDDTILVIPKSTKQTKALRRQLAELFGLE